ncbi:MULTISPECIES: CopG family transcriptional regulator [Yersinia]|uniref:CopG family transcriptional regulator n=2 Tax=Yersinia TaxID=629 RepID=A0A0T9RLZ7_9GAMM|nr:MULTISPECIES: CopG family transcriptional regulator [Yersinia]AHK22067.1 CopG family transcriptional regulator [Yersinia similis]CFQ66811.1 Uncharacterised protein [Yersinia similis]CNB81517.1 Uncharacterised protein [Yersinia similis]CNI71138.1 Uncharacterised protein [Yersinia pekkanenii]CRY69266.1 Uncharacterised protein [Yersinia pekkanenii]
MAITKPPKKKTDIDNIAADAFISGAPDAQATKPKGVKKGKKQQITLTISPELLEKIDEKAAEIGQSRAGYINMACHNAVDHGIQIKGNKSEL